MNAYLFTAAVTCSGLHPMTIQREGIVDVVQSWESSMSLIIYGGTREQAQQRFETRLLAPSESKNPIEIKINQVVSAPVIEHLFTESGHEPIDWPQLSRQLRADVPNPDAEDVMERGYWADASQLVRPEGLAPDIESLRQSLPEDVSPGFNWSPDKQFFFLVSVLATTPPTSEILGQTEREPDPEETSYSAEPPEEVPKLTAAEAYAGVLARNTVVAAWLWRKFAAATSLAANEIEVSEWSCFPEPFEIVKEQ